MSSIGGVTVTASGTCVVVEVGGTACYLNPAEARELAAKLLAQADAVAGRRAGSK